MMPLTKEAGSDSEGSERTAAVRMSYQSLAAANKKQLSAFKRSKAPAKELEGVWDIFFDIHMKSKQPPRVVGMLMEEP